ncbi:PD-(D/E)XK nuclease family transposase [Candidatus Tisiphia endosymbiont of Parasteatoda lunata]|uniref:PD-(D/E)XK nuclease family transposase n=1 Tax=Candidatus Tisiphia endosymbiont of Parasteatoda lunata TaxID=3066275 RepID=UPI0039775C72
MPTIQIPEIAAKKQSVVDVLCKDENGVQLIIEMQVSPQEGFEKRAQYYAAKAYSRQLNKGKEEGARYIDLKSVIFIVPLWEKNPALAVRRFNINFKYLIKKR